MPIFSLVEQLTHSSLHQMALYDLILKFTSLYKIFSIMSLISFYLRKFRIDFSQVGVRCKNNSVQCVPHDHFKKKVPTFITNIELHNGQESRKTSFLGFYY